MIKKVVIATHSFSPGTSQAFRDYCIKKRFDVLFIEHPLFGNIFSWLFGAFDTLLQVIRKRTKCDLYVGSNRLNTIVGIILKNFGIAIKVVYFSPDWSKNRFKNNLLNFIFQKLDYFCVKYADVVWNSSTIMPIDPMMKEREKLGYPQEWRKKQIQISDGCDLLLIPPFDLINRYQIGYVGHLIKHCGVQLAIDAFPSIAKEFPQAKLLIIGSGPMEDELRRKAQGMNIEFTGFMGDIKQVYERLLTCAFAIAPYEESKETISQFTDPGKVKNYFSVGLPVVITKVPQIAYEVDEEKCGIAIRYDINEFIDSISILFGNKNKLKEYRKNVLKLRKKYSWDSIFDRALCYTDEVIYEKK